MTTFRIGHKRTNYTPQVVYRLCIEQSYSNAPQRYSESVDLLGVAEASDAYRHSAFGQIEGAELAILVVAPA